MKVIMIAAMTLCGRISPAIMGSGEDRKLLERSRAQTDASLLGASTLRAANPEMRGPGGVLLPRIRAIISATGDIPIKNKALFAAGPKPLVFTSLDNVAVLRKNMDDKAEVHGLPRDDKGGLLLNAALAVLQKKNVRNLLIEGGGGVNYAALAAGIVDELYLTITPYLSGDVHAPSLVDGPVSLGDPFLRVQLVSLERSQSDELFCHYKIIHH